jgi:hypothetical protein
VRYRKSEGCHAIGRRGDRRRAVFSIFFLRPKDYGLASQQMHRFFYVYILVSESDESIHYSGVTRDLDARLIKHNQGKCIHTSKDRPHGGAAHC